MKILFLIFYLLSADKSDYDGKNLVFSGKFQVEHPMGTLKAEKATLKDLQLQGSEKKGYPLLLEDGVSIESTQGKTPFSIFSRSATAELPPRFLLSLFQFQELQFFDDVAIHTLHGISATGGLALYKTGSLTLYPAIPTSHCHLHRGLDRIDAHEIRFDLLSEELHCINPRGAFAPTVKYPSLSFSSETLLWQKRQEKLSLSGEVFIEQSDQFSIHSDRALLTFHDQLEPELCLFEGNVRLFSPRIQDKPSFAVADQITFHPLQQTLILSAESPKRVLFWQEGFSLSAPEILIQKDPLTQKESIVGKGDVHFAFDSHEENIIEQLLSKYL